MLYIYSLAYCVHFSLIYLAPKPTSSLPQNRKPLRVRTQNGKSSVLNKPERTRTASSQQGTRSLRESQKADVLPNQPIHPRFQPQLRDQHPLTDLDQPSQRSFLDSELLVSDEEGGDDTVTSSPTMNSSRLALADNLKPDGGVVRITPDVTSPPKPYVLFYGLFCLCVV